VVALLVLATYLYEGYVFPTWPQPGFFDDVLRLRGELPGDWYTSLPPQHWAFVHLLALVPGSAVRPFLAGIWVVTYAALWAGFTLVARTLGAGWTTALATGLVAIPTGFAGVGDSAVVFGYVYPSELAFAALLLAVAALLRGKPFWVGAALGAAILFHPGLGALGAAVVVPVAAVVWRRPRPLLAAAVPLALIGGPFAAIAARNQGAGGMLPPHRSFELLVHVRLPHHLLYGAFPAWQWLELAVWAAFVPAVLCARARMGARFTTLGVTAACAVAMAIGAAAAAWGGPTLLAEAQTSRLSALVVALGACVAAALVERFAGPAGAVALVVAAVLEPTVGDRLTLHVPAITRGAAGAMLVAAIVAGGIAAAAVGRSWTLPRPALPAVLVAALLVYGLHAAVSSRASQAYAAGYEALAGVARAASRPADVVLTPPQLDGFRTLAHRPIVVDFGSFPFGGGEREWVRRMDAVTGDPRVLDPRLGDDVAVRTALMARDYQHVVQTQKRVLCRYGVRLVLASPLRNPPPWLSPLTTRGGLELLRVRAGSCGTS
jgi:hypothetical protein